MNSAAKISEASTDAATATAARLLAEHGLETERKKQIRLQQMLEDEKQRKIQRQIELEQDEEAHKKAIEEDKRKALKSRDEIIEEFKKSIEEYKKALAGFEQSVNFQNMCNEYLELAKQNKDLMELLHHFIKSPVDPLLIRAVMFGDLERAMAAIKLGADVNALDLQRETPLHRACAAKNLEMVKYLLSCGALTNIKNAEGKTAKEMTSNSEIYNLICTNYKINDKQHIDKSFGANPYMLFSNHPQQKALKIQSYANQNINRSYAIG